MCFMLHIASGIGLTRRAWNENDRHVWTGDVDEHAELVKEHFSLPNVAYIGSDLNCGCGFRNVSFQSGGWPEEWLIEEGEMDTEGTDKNHQELHTFLTEAFRHSAAVELYGCWNGDYGAKTEQQQDLEPDAILSERFFFRERVLYRVTSKPNNGMQANPRTSRR